MNRDLAGKSVLVTRPEHQADELAVPLRDLGATVFVAPAIAIAAPANIAPLDAALREIERFDWVVLTSVNGVEAVHSRMDRLGIPPSALAERRLAVIGPATGRALADAVREPDLTPDEYVSEAIAEALGDVRGQKLLLTRADIARKDLADILRARGAEVTEVAAYRIAPPEGPVVLPETTPDFITLTSASAVKGTRNLLAGAGREDWLRASVLACIGPITAAAVRDLGLEPAVVAREYTIAGLIDAIVAYSRETAHA